ncbi:hypothetical protein GALL_429140 [mine drainage metagenome]|uniref:Uncharacterized protein n=1 Tax=mine drainage metagenome TaxID=410659 RepID=A0A1J5PUZ7_9ZZZZ
MQGLRTEDQVHIGRALDDGRTFLAGDAAGHADAQPRLFALERAQPPQIAEYLVLRLLADRAGVEQDEIGVLGILHGFVVLVGAEHVDHLGRVVRVHLATEGLDIEFFHGA